jgi:antitoxin component YwqK of YwqJK toxin-antitoxin module
VLKTDFGNTISTTGKEKPKDFTKTGKKSGKWKIYDENEKIASIEEF